MEPLRRMRVQSRRARVRRSWLAYSRTRVAWRTPRGAGAHRGQRSTVKGHIRILCHGFVQLMPCILRRSMDFVPMMPWILRDMAHRFTYHGFCANHATHFASDAMNFSRRNFVRFGIPYKGARAPCTVRTCVLFSSCNGACAYWMYIHNG